MKNFYEILGVDEKASFLEIKRAYRKAAMENHPDKGGSDEKMALIVEAYAALSDPAKRRDFEARWKLFQQTDIDYEEEFIACAYLDAGDVQPFSKEFRDEHRVFVTQYTREPLEPVSASINFLPFESGVYSLNTSAGRKEHKGESKEIKTERKREEATENVSTVIQKIHDIFTFIAQKAASATNSVPASTLPFSREPLSPTIAVNILTDFLFGSYYGASLNQLKTYLLSAIGKIKKAAPQTAALLLYEGVFEIILLTERSADERHTLLLSIKKITDFVKKLSDEESASFMPLFYSKNFRNLYAYALHLFWRSSQDALGSERTKQFGGREEAKEFFKTLRDRLADSKADDSLSELIRYVRLLYSLEKDLSEVKSDTLTAAYYRDKAFHLLDWMPAVTTNSNRKIVVNLFLQIGVHFQRASRLETRPAIKMADERLALKMYLTCIGIGHRATPDIELYASTQVLKFLATFHYQNPLLKEAMPAIQKRALVIADVFPLFDDLQSNIRFLMEADKPLHLMRSLLNAMLACLEYNKTHTKTMPIDHTAATVLYQVYEACLKNWYQERYDPDLEKRIRMELMEELLFEKGWTFLDVDQNVDSPWIMVGRDEHGWIKPSRSLPYTDEAKIEIFQAINGAEINQRTGEITFFLEPWKKTGSPYEKLFTTFDLQEMLEKNLAVAIFSLDPIDPDKPYHPFNNMRFAPAQLAESELFNTMLLTDYTLKFLTTKQEVLGRYPYEQRPVDKMIEHLPEYLREIIHNFHQEKPSGEVHRFWIEAEGIDIAVSDDEEAKGYGASRIGLGVLKMVVKKHKMKRDLHGELKDTGDEDEGWPIYVLTPEQINELTSGRRVIAGHAMIFVYAQNKMIFWENNKLVKEHAPIEFREMLIRLYKQPKDETGKVTQSTKNMPLIYRVTKTMATQAQLAHRYSAEFIFAHEFTTHYDEFAQYLPEFGRLRELSKISALIRFLSNLREANREQIRAIKVLLDEDSEAKSLDTKVYERYQESVRKTQQNIVSLFDRWQLQASTSKLTEKHKEKLKEIQSQISRTPSGQRWRYRPQLEGIFSELKTSVSSSTFHNMIQSFINGDIVPLTKALVNYESAKVCSDINEQFPASTAYDIASALYGSNEAVDRVAKEESHRQLREVKETKEALETGFVRVGLGKKEKAAETSEGRCFWVPASVRHEVGRIDTRGLARYSFFVYGGVSIQPNLNIVKGAGGPLGGSPVGGGSLKVVETNPLLDVLKNAKLTSGKTNQLESTLADGTKVIFRRDIGEHAHPIGRTYTKPVDHYNIEVHSPHPVRPGKYAPKENIHIIVDKNLNPVDVIFKNQNPINRRYYGK